MFDITPTMLFFSIFISFIGMAYYYYGKKNGLHFKLAGVALMLFPYFITETWILICVGAGLMVAPFILNYIGFED